MLQVYRLIVSDPSESSGDDMKRTRRAFLHEAFSVCSAFGVGAALTAMSGRLALGEVVSRRTATLVDAIDETTGLSLVRLPEGFRYMSFGWTGDPMQDGLATPSDHDGMGVVRADGPIVTLVRNHEVSDHGPSLASAAVAPFDPRRKRVAPLCSSIPSAASF